MRGFYVKIVVALVVANVGFAVLGSCASRFNDDESGLREAVDSFSLAYFNWHFRDAVHYVDQESVVWLDYAASQVNQEDVDSLKAMSNGAFVELKDVKGSGSCRVATVEARGFLSFDSIGRSPRIINTATFQLPVKQIGESWKVVLRSLPRQVRM